VQQVRVELGLGQVGEQDPAHGGGPRRQPVPTVSEIVMVRLAEAPARNQVVAVEDATEHDSCSSSTRSSGGWAIWATLNEDG
jgi:hypothetical protein